MPKSFDVLLLSRQLAAAMLVACLTSTVAVAQDDADDGSPKPEKLFESNETLAVTLHAPWRDIVRKQDVQDPYPARLEFTDSLGQAHSVPATVERRGITRQVVCRYPPIKLRFNKEDVKGTTFRGQDELKMVTHCDKGDRWEQYYIKEYLAYRFYNTMTELSYRVRPLAITYVDSDSGKGEDPRFAFLIEETKDVAKRNDLGKLDIAETLPSKLEPMQASRFALFQLLISNVDFESLSGPKEDRCCHNARLIGNDPNVDVIAVPYDFDSSGFVDTHYAAPNEFLGINRVTQRLYRGFCAHNGTLQDARQEYLAKEAEIMGLIASEQRLASRTAKTANKFIGEFFEMLRDDGDFQKDVIGKCRK